MGKWQGVGIRGAGGAGRRVARVSEGEDRALTHVVDRVGRAHLRHKSHGSMHAYVASVRHGNSRGLLSAMLEREEREVSQVRDVDPLLRTDTENSTHQKMSPSQAWRISARGKRNWPSNSIVSPPARPSSEISTWCRRARDCSSGIAREGRLTMKRLGDSPKNTGSLRRGASGLIAGQRTPTPPSKQHSASATSIPPSAQS